jgi:sodium/potassium/calcium exchanger 6
MSKGRCDYTVDGNGPLQIDYEYLYYCQFQDYENLFIFLLLLWIIYLTSLLGNTAANYFSPTLGSICVKLNLSYSFAGVTFLAFGNGSPDVFSSFASVAGSADMLVGIGALLGGSVFITTVVVGSISILCPSQVSKYTFGRDVSFHLLAIFLVTVVGGMGEGPLYMAFIFSAIC